MHAHAEAPTIDTAVIDPKTGDVSYQNFCDYVQALASHRAGCSKRPRCLVRMSAAGHFKSVVATCGSCEALAVDGFDNYTIVILFDMDLQNRSLAPALEHWLEALRDDDDDEITLERITLPPDATVPSLID